MASQSLADRYVAKEALGSGSFGKVYKVQERETMKIYACKEINYGKMSSKEKELLVSEVNILREFRNPHIVRYVDRVLDKAKCIIYIIMEFCGGGDLAAYIRRHRVQRSYVKEEVIWNVFIQALVALHECHNHRPHRVLHRDIKPGNIMLDAKQRIKLGDFGLSRTLHAGSLARTRVGTPLYMSPEQLLFKPYDFRSDIWGLGCLVFELAFGHPPFNVKTRDELTSRIRAKPRVELPRHPGLSEDFYKLVSGMLQWMPERRFTIQDVLQHPFFTAHAAELPDPRALPPRLDWYGAIEAHIASGIRRGTPMTDFSPAEHSTRHTRTNSERSRNRSAEKEKFSFIRARRPSIQRPESARAQDKPQSQETILPKRPLSSDVAQSERGSDTLMVKAYSVANSLIAPCFEPLARELTSASAASGPRQLTSHLYSILSSKGAVTKLLATCHEYTERQDNVGYIEEVPVSAVIVCFLEYLCCLLGCDFAPATFTFPLNFRAVCYPVPLPNKQEKVLAFTPGFQTLAATASVVGLEPLANTLTRIAHALAGAVARQRKANSSETMRYLKASALAMACIAQCFTLSQLLLPNILPFLPSSCSTNSIRGAIKLFDLSSRHSQSVTAHDFSAADEQRFFHEHFEKMNQNTNEVVRVLRRLSREFYTLAGLFVVPASKLAQDAIVGRTVAEFSHPSDVAHILLQFFVQYGAYITDPRPHMTRWLETDYTAGEANAKGRAWTFSDFLRHHQRTPSGSKPVDEYSGRNPLFRTSQPASQASESAASPRPHSPYSQSSFANGPTAHIIKDFGAVPAPKLDTPFGYALGGLKLSVLRCHVFIVDMSIILSPASVLKSAPASLSAFVPLYSQHLPFYMKTGTLEKENTMQRVSDRAADVLSTLVSVIPFLTLERSAPPAKEDDAYDLSVELNNMSLLALTAFVRDDHLNFMPQQRIDYFQPPPAGAVQSWPQAGALAPAQAVAYVLDHPFVHFAPGSERRKLEEALRGTSVKSKIGYPLLQVSRLRLFASQLLAHFLQPAAFRSLVSDALGRLEFPKKARLNTFLRVAAIQVLIYISPFAARFRGLHLSSRTRSGAGEDAHEAQRSTDISLEASLPALVDNVFKTSRLEETNALLSFIAGALGHATPTLFRRLASNADALVGFVRDEVGASKGGPSLAPGRVMRLLRVYRIAAFLSFPEQVQSLFRAVFGECYFSALATSEAAVAPALILELLDFIPAICEMFKKSPPLPFTPDIGTVDALSVFVFAFYKSSAPAAAETSLLPATPRAAHSVEASGAHDLQQSDASLAAFSLAQLLLQSTAPSAPQLRGQRYMFGPVAVLAILRVWLGILNQELSHPLSVFPLVKNSPPTALFASFVHDVLRVALRLMSGRHLKRLLQFPLDAGGGAQILDQIFQTCGYVLYLLVKWRRTDVALDTARASFRVGAADLAATVLCENAAKNLLKAMRYCNAKSVRFAVATLLNLAQLIDGFSAHIVAAGGLLCDNIHSVLAIGDDSLNCDLLQILDELASESKLYSDALLTNLPSSDIRALVFSPSRRVKMGALSLVGNLCRQSDRCHILLCSTRIIPHVVEILRGDDEEMAAHACFVVGNCAFHSAQFYAQFAPVLADLARLLDSANALTVLNTVTALGNLVKNSDELVPQMMQLGIPYRLVDIFRLASNDDRETIIMALAVMAQHEPIREQLRSMGIGMLIKSSFLSHRRRVSGDLAQHIRRLTGD
eukprot:gnl/Chilomastix_cuspidata/1075.p1 GENE.gnl/Chilomastix_cuspidata/1075~~gnl/Chilomastix_cuspidata/1075.p1  ORF type:complete len:1720 (-),score=761.96 gnl/Chilomastix_cuspidata/1075:44-5203(-)